MSGVSTTIDTEVGLHSSHMGASSQLVHRNQGQETLWGEAIQTTQKQNILKNLWVGEGLRMRAP